MAHIGIVGGGIIGCATALHLLDRGHQVTIIERDAGGLPASVGNAGILAVPEIDPIARPGMLLSAPRWLLDPLGPLEPPGRGDDPLSEHRLERAFRRQLLHEGRLERRELGDVSSGSTT